MHSRVRELDWGSTSVGPAERWPQSLRATITLLLGSRYPMILLWGPELLQIYNEAYIRLIGAKHPGALGRSIRVTQAESWAIIGPMIHEVMSTGVPNWVPAQLLPLDRSGYREESYFSLSYSAVGGDDGGAAGMLCVCSEVTQQVLGERRSKLLRELALEAGEARSVDATSQSLMLTLAGHPLDVPFSAVYLPEEGGRALILSQSFGLGAASSLPARVELARAPRAPGSAEEDALLRAVASQRSEVLSGLDERTAPPGGPWGQPVDTALVLPLEAPGQGLLGVLVAGKSPNRALDESHRSFYELLRGQVGLAIRNAAAIEDERRRSEALAELDRAKTTFFSNISHEFRTPLTLILGPVEDALERGGGSLSGADLFAVHASSLRLLRLVNNLLEFSRLEAGHVPSVLEPVDLALLTLDLASSFRSLVERAGLGFVVDCPPLSRPVPIDRTQWEKVVLNLLSNAFKFTFQGQIRLSLTERGDRAELVVEDTGAGIPEHELPRIFERFHRVQGAHGRSMEGTGIGLSLVAELVRHRGGQVRAESVAGAGSTFTVSIPLALPPLLQTSPARAEAERGAETGSGAAASFVYVREAESWLPPEQRRALPEGLLADEQDEPPARAPRRPGAAEEPARVLIVDDNGDLRRYLARLLEKHWQVDAAEDGVAALELARRARPDVVISDVMMPRLDGIGLLRALRREPLTATVPVILLSARAGEESVVEGLETGADDYLVKPFSARELLSRVRTQLTLSRMRRAVAEAEERERGHSVLQFLAHASAAAAESLDYQATLARVTRLAVPILADWCFIDLLTEEGEVVRVEVAHADPADAELALQLKAFPASLRGNRDNPPVRTLVEGRPVLVEALDPELMRSLAHNDAHFSVMQRVNARSFMSVPLVARGRRIGSLSLATSVSGRRYGPRDVTVAEDLARRCALAVDNARLYQEAQAAIAARDRFLSIASHELRTPLTPLQLSLHSLERRAPAIVEDEQSREWLQDKLRLLRRQAERIDRLVTELLDVTRITNDQLRLSPEPAELSEIAREVLDRFEQTGELARSGCEVELSAASPVCGHWDRLRIDQVLTNLLENALKFGEKKPIRVAIERRGARALVAVSDRGLGIAPADQSRIFERFERAVPEQHYGGLGLGLWIVRRIVEAMGGSIHVESRPDQGATFEVELPLGGAPGAPTT